MKLVLLLSLLVTTSCTLLNKQSAHKSIVFTEYGSAAYSQKSSQLYIDYLKKTRANMASILFTCHTQNKTSAKIDCDSSDSPKIKNLTHLIKQLKENGFDVSLRVYVDLLSGDWRAYWDPKDKKQAFKNLKEMLIKFSKYSKENGIQLFIIGAEYEKLTQPEFKTEWIQIISSIRQIYSGQLTYGANSNFTTYKVPEYQWVPFWASLDFFGIDHYPAFAGKLPSKEKLIAHHKKYLNNYKKISNKNKLDIYFNEVGFPLAKNGHKKPYEWNWSKDETSDPNQQAISIDAFLSSLAKENIKGVALWRYMPGEEKIHPKGYIVDQKQAIHAIKMGFQKL